MFSCPLCHTEIRLEPNHMICVNGHFFPKKEGVYQLIFPEYKLMLEDYLDSFDDYRKTTHTNINKENVNQLPKVSFDPSIWRLRAYDLELISKIITSEKPLNILDLGAWNGWLSHQLAAKGHHVTAVDYFMAPFDGLQTVSYYDNPFLAVQANLNDLSFLKKQYDVIVINRCYPYFEDIQTQIDTLKKLLNDNGTIIITGLNSFKNPTSIIKNLKTSDDNFSKKYGKSFFFCIFKGYVNKSDLENLRKNGFELKLYSQLRFKSLLSKILANKPAYWFATYRKK